MPQMDEFEVLSFSRLNHVTMSVTQIGYRNPHIHQALEMCLVLEGEADVWARGRFAYDFCDTGMVCPLAKMYTLGSGFIPAPNHAGGLRYHGMSSILSQLYHDGYMEAVAVEQTKVFEAAELFARVEGILPAPESSHAIRAAIDEALKCRETGEEKTIVFGLTGTGYFDLVAYEKFNNGEMSDYIPTDAELEASFAKLPHVPGQA